MEVADDIQPELKPAAAVRLAAVQALFQIEQSGDDVGKIAMQFIAHRLPENADADLFESLVKGTAAAMPVLDQQIGEALKSGWTVQRLDPTLRAILRCGLFELSHRTHEPARLLLDHYVDLAGSFFPDKETAFANAVLDRLARDIRPGQLNA
ncbi:transcription antitermination factor NusB [Hyphobacterium sp.]|uniref:transcription antitermination factor NusB n=1 Tax=Hyphobacterium sp. TaxID=2004662 RepID=UPI003BAC97B7